MFQCSIRAIGKYPESWQQEAASIYQKRLKPLISLEVIECPEGHAGSQTMDHDKTRHHEAEALLKGISKDSFVVALDETGKSMSSTTFSQALTDWCEHGQRPVVFCIGGSWGLDASVRARANAILSLGLMTLPHGFARIVLLEQLYRAVMIQQGKTYHK